MLKRAIKRAAHSLGFEIARVQDSTNDVELERLKWLMLLRDQNSLTENAPTFVDFCAQHFTASKSQLFQDLFVLYRLGQKRNGYFVEFGATDGVSLSNTYLLEKAYAWKGILAEPGRSWHAALKNNRTADICFDCVWRQSGETLEFQETDWKEISTIATFAGHDSHAEARKHGHAYDVSTISLNHLLERHRAPSYIDYLSIDTEGSELEILSAFDFARWRFGIVTVEHNYTANRQRIFELLTAHGYQRVLSEYSNFDDWFVHQRLA